MDAAVWTTEHENKHETRPLPQMLEATAELMAEMSADEPGEAPLQRSGAGRWRQQLLLPEVRRELYVGVGLQVLQQLAGINTVMYFAPTLMQLGGLSSKRTALLAAVGPAGVNALGTLVGMWAIDRWEMSRQLCGSAFCAG